MEEWLVIEEFPNYEISNFGRIKRITPAKRTWVGRIMKPYIDQDGYSRLILQKEGKRFQKYLHYLVLEAFVCSRPENMFCRHLDGNPSNNHVSNLKWGTSKENSEDRTRHGKSFFVNNNPKTKLTDKQVLEIRKDNRSLSKIAKDYGIYKSTAGRIKSGKIRKQVLERIDYD